MSRQEPMHQRTDLHFVWVALLFSIVIGVGAWLGVPGMIVPMGLLFIAFILAIAYVWIMWPKLGRWRVLLTVVVCGGFSWMAWSFWFLFVIHSQIRFFNAGAYPAGGEQALFIVELRNEGKATSLLGWRATLTTSDGHVFESLPLTLDGESTDILASDKQKTSYVLPDCDLRFETVRAIQPGDSVYGIVDVRFPDYPPGPIADDTKIELIATDILNRKIKTGKSTLKELRELPAEVIPCKALKQQ